MHVVVVGAGVFGVWTARHLLEGGARVTLVDAYGPGNSRSSSGDETRLLRSGYGADAIYSELARRSLDQWRALEARVGPGAEPLWHPCGVLWLAAGDDTYTRQTLATLAAGDHRVDVLDARSMQARFPLINGDGIETALLERDAGVLMARQAVRALAADLERRGVRLVRSRVAPAASGLDDVPTVDGAGAADALVFACGAWLPQLFPALLRGRIRPTRQVVAYFGTPAGDSRFEASRWPAWIDFPAGIYGTPDIAGRGVKVGIDEHGPPFDPESADRLADQASVERARRWLSQRVPALADAPVVESRVCQYENTATGDFLIDRHPARTDVWIVGGGSGHGFKHGPAVGEIAARMVSTGEPPVPRFALEQKARDVSRSVF